MTAACTSIWPWTIARLRPKRARARCAARYRWSLRVLLSRLYVEVGRAQHLVEISVVDRRHGAQSLDRRLVGAARLGVANQLVLAGGEVGVDQGGRDGVCVPEARRHQRSPFGPYARSLGACASFPSFCSSAFAASVAFLSGVPLLSSSSRSLVRFTSYEWLPGLGMSSPYPRREPKSH